MTDVDIVVEEWDGAAWYEDGRIVVNVRWLNVEDEAVWYIDESFIHEYVEHVLGLGHRCAVFVERVLRRLLYSEWFGLDPAAILYGARARGARGAGPRGRAHQGQDLHGLHAREEGGGAGHAGGPGPLRRRLRQGGAAGAGAPGLRAANR